MSPDECTVHQDPDRQRIPDQSSTPAFRSATHRGADEDDWTESENWNYEGKIEASGPFGRMGLSALWFFPACGSGAVVAGPPCASFSTP